MTKGFYDFDFDVDDGVIAKIGGSMKFSICVIYVVGNCTYLMTLTSALLI